VIFSNDPRRIAVNQQAGTVKASKTSTKRSACRCMISTFFFGSVICYSSQLMAVS